MRISRAILGAVTLIGVIAAFAIVMPDVRALPGIASRVWRSAGAPEGPGSASLSPAAGGISGFVFLDRDGDGARDADEAGLAGVSVAARDLATNGQVYDATTSTAADGSYQFAGLPANTYQLTETDPSGYLSTTLNSLEVVVGTSPVSDVNFGDAIPRTVSGTVFTDSNSDGVQQPNEAGIPDRLVDVVDDLNDNGVADTGEPQLGSSVTDLQGNYAIGGIKPGPRVVRVFPDMGGAGQPAQKRKHVISDEVSGASASVDLAIGAGGWALDEPGEADAAEAPYAPDQIMARFLPGVSPERAAQILAANGLTVRMHIEGIDVYVLGTGEERPEDVVEALSRLPEVEYAELDYVVQGARIPTDPEYQDPALVYAPRIINAEAAWDATRGSSGVVVAVVDSGVSLSHPELASHLMSCGTGICDIINYDSNPADDHGHGTHVTGIILAAMDNGIGSTGIAPGVMVMPVKSLRPDGYGGTTGTWSQIAAGIDYAVTHGADIINLSLGGTTTSVTMLNAIRNAANQGVFVVAAVGNNSSSTPFYPAYYPEAFAVSATENHDQYYTLSNYGSWVDISAPGFAVFSTHWTSSNPSAYTYMSGTSQAAPHVSALAALLLSVRPDLGPADLRALIQQTAADLGTAGRDDYFGWGRIDAGAALAASGGWATVTPTPSPTGTATATATATRTHTPTVTPTPLHTYTPTATATATATSTPTATATGTATPTSSPTPTASPTPTTAPYEQPVNCGSVSYTDTTGQVWAADKAFVAGSWGYTTRTAKSSTTAVAGTEDDFLYQKYVEIVGEYKFTVPNGVYQITMKFAEFATTSSTDRLQTISLEGSPVDTFSIYALAGAKAKALDKTYTVTVSDGLLNIAFAKASGARKSPAVSAIQVRTAGPPPTPTPTNTPCLTCPTSTPTPTVTPTRTPVPYLQRANSGSVSYTDTLQQVWAADQKFATGKWGYTLGNARSSSNPVSGTEDDFLYQKYREKPGEYKFTVPNGTYEITLKFAEFVVTDPNSRLQTISLEGAPVDTFSVWNLVGSNTALDRKYTVTVTDGLLNILFARGSGAGKDPIVSAVEVKTKQN